MWPLPHLELTLVFFFFWFPKDLKDQKLQSFTSFMFSYLDLPKGLIGTPTGRLNSLKTNNKELQDHQAFPNFPPEMILSNPRLNSWELRPPKDDPNGSPTNCPPRKEGSPGNPLDLRHPVIYRRFWDLKLDTSPVFWRVEKTLPVWWFFSNPFEKYARQNGNLPQFSGWKIKNIWNHHLSYVFRGFLDV